jgi:hypothetical protein
MSDAGSPEDDVDSTDACFDSTDAKNDASLLAAGFGFTGESRSSASLDVCKAQARLLREAGLMLASTEEKRREGIAG